MFIENTFKGKYRPAYYALGLALVMLAFLIGNIPYGFYAIALKQMGINSTIESDMAQIGISGITNAEMFIFSMIPFIFGFIAIFLIIVYLHKRNWKTLVTNRERMSKNRIFAGFFFWLLAMLFAEIIFYAISPEMYTFTFEPNGFFTFLLLGLLFIPFQAGTEELLLRGYLLQGLWWMRYRWLIIIMAASIFGILHAGNPETDTFGGAVFIYYIGFGVFAGMWTLLDDGLEIATGVHIANNLYGAVIVSSKGSLFATPSLLRTNEISVWQTIIAWFILSVIFTLLVGKIFKFKSIKFLFQKIEKPVETL